MLKTLGGDRLGSGKKMKVELHNYERSSHNLGCLARTTISAGTLVPIYVKVMLPGDTFDIDLDAFINTHPTIGPLFGSLKAQFDAFVAPIRIYNGLLHNNKLGIGKKMSDVKFPQLELFAMPTDQPGQAGKDFDNQQINPSCIFSYLGIRGVGTNYSVDNVPKSRKFNGTSWLMYWDIIKNYYCNKQEENGWVIHTPVSALVSHVDTIAIVNPGTGATTAIPQAPTVGPALTGQGATLELTVTTGSQPLRS